MYIGHKLAVQRGKKVGEEGKGHLIMTSAYMYVHEGMRAIRDDPLPRSAIPDICSRLARLE